MAKLGYDADPNNLPEKGNYVPLPVGDVEVRAIACEIDENANGKQQVVWEFEVVSGLNEGKKHREWVTIKNPDGYTPPSTGDPAQIGQKLNNQFAAAAGIIGEDAGDTDNYLFKPVMAYIKAKRPYKKADGTEVTDGRQIGSFKPIAGNAGAARQTATTNTGGTGTTNTETNASPSNNKPNATKAPDGKYYDDDGNVVPVFKLSGYNKIGG